MSTQQRADPSAPLRITEVAAACGLSRDTLSRLCQYGQLRWEVGGQGRLVRPGDVEQYVRARRPAGLPHIALVLEGDAPRGHHDSGAGWRFRAVIDDGTPTAVHIWLSDTLIKLLERDHRDPRETVLRAAETCVADALLVADELSEGTELLYGAPDHAFVLYAAGADR
jgi:hypothetical protein